MLLTKWKEGTNPLVEFDPFGALSLFDDRLLSPFWSENNSFVPPINVSESDTGYKVTLEAPGMEKDDIKIEIENDTLTLSGEKKESHEEKDGKHYRLERKYGVFSRALRFVDVDGDKIRANYKNGVLEVTVPKSETAKPKKIAIT